MDNSWENHEPSPIEFFHGRVMDEFHKFRKQNTKTTYVLMDGIEFNNIIVAAKNATYEKYKALNLDKAVPKSAIINMDHLPGIESAEEIMQRFVEKGIIIENGSENLGFDLELEMLINRYSLQTESNTPDFILAEYLKNCLNSFNQAIKSRTSYNENGILNYPLTPDEAFEPTEQVKDDLIIRNETNNYGALEEALERANLEVEASILFDIVKDKPQNTNDAAKE